MARILAATLAFVFVMQVVTLGAAGLEAGPTDLTTSGETIESTGSTESSTDDCSTCATLGERLLPFTVTQPLEAVAVEAHALVERLGGSRMPGPDQIPAMERLPEDVRREAWRAWVITSWQSIERGDTPGMFERTLADQQPIPGFPETSSDDGTIGLRSLWRLEGHGYPRQVLPADENGGHFLITSQAALRFESPGSDPAWMVKPDGYIGATDVTDANGDGVNDLVLSIMNFNIYVQLLFPEYYGAPEDTGPSVIVMDGATGKTLFQGFENTEYLRGWTLTDVDGDGATDLLGYTYAGQLVAAKLDGTRLYTETPTSSLDAGEGTYPSVWLFYSQGAFGYGDVDGDGTKDLVMTNQVATYLLIPVMFMTAYTPTVSAFSGADGSLLWEAPVKTPSASTFSFSYLLAIADLDGDGTDDPLVYYFDYTFEGALVAGVRILETGYVALRGTDGAPLIRDAEAGASTFAPVVPPLGGSTPPIPWELDVVVDLDGDGANELVTFEFDEEQEMPTFLVGRVPGDVAGGPSVEDFRVPLDLPQYDDGDGYGTLRDIDGDGVAEYVVAMVGIRLNDNDEIEAIESKLIVLDATKMTVIDLPRLTAFYEFDELNGQAYGWTIEDDRFVPLDAEGAPTDDGLRLVVSPYPVAAFDHSRDGVPDILLRKTMGLTWVDGRNGGLLEDVPRPAGRFIRSLVVDDDRILLLEYAWSSGNYHLTELTADRPIWTLDAEELEDGYLRMASDVTGDGRPEAIVNTWGSGDGDPMTKVVEVDKGETVWEIIRNNRFANFYDLVPSRPGSEIVVQSYKGYVCGFNDAGFFTCEADPDGENSVGLHVPEKQEPLWKFVAEDDDESVFLSAFNDGVAALGVYASENRSVRVIGAANGTELYRTALPEDVRSWSIGLEPIDADASADLVFVYEVGEPGEPQESTLRVTDWRTGDVVAEHPLAKDHTGDLGGIYLRGYVDDWDGDRWTDILVQEFDRPVIYSSQDGTRLAAAAKGTYVALIEDFNRDGVSEIGVMDDTSRLRLFTYDRGVNETIDDSDIRVLADPLKPQTDPGAEDFFEEPKTPGPGALLALVALLGAAAAVRRRRA